MKFDLEKLVAHVAEIGVDVGGKLLGALAIWIVGRWLIKFALRLLQKSLETKHVDQTVTTYAQNALGLLLNVALIVAILGFFGVETTSFAAVLAAGGVAIGMAWSGLLAHFAAGIFMVVLRPFQVGDFVQAGGVTGTVVEVGLFVTVINTLDNVKTVIGNNKIFSDNISNFTANPFRRVDLVAQIDHTVSPKVAMEKLRESISKIDNIDKKQNPEIDILEFNLAGTKLSVRPFCHNKDYWQVYFDTNRVIAETFGAAQFPAPTVHTAFHGGQPAA